MTAGTAKPGKQLALEDVASGQRLVILAVVFNLLTMAFTWVIGDLAGLHLEAQYLMATAGKLPDAGRHQPDAKLVCLNLLWNAYDHVCLLIVRC
jgi:hypothetical protein